MTVHFIGAGPGAADLMTLRGRAILERAPLCLYAGSIIPPEILAFCGPETRQIDTAPLCLDEIEALFVAAHEAGEDVARLHSGDLSLYSAVAEQIVRLERRGIAYTLTPGVPAFAAASAALGRELTVPGVVQSVVLTRLSGRASAMPGAETLEAFAATGATLAIHLAVHRLNEIVDRLLPFYGPTCPVAVVARASWPEERCVLGSLETIVSIMAAEPEVRTALVLVGKALKPGVFRESALYDAGYQRRFRGRDMDDRLPEILRPIV
ncbi:precorrin-4 C(11)-methyltransferase [Asaia bogorensis]|uniref:precorrin-4 C(11)-methyltransferase n=1 Tax=Asaia bogorensis TaxID=91915 RepID=UPI000EFAF56B|nr:precorrin-4 C(11)-methyltransferase [Asaia bogorensis]